MHMTVRQPAEPRHAVPLDGFIVECVDRLRFNRVYSQVRLLVCFGICTAIRLSTE